MRVTRRAALIAAAGSLTGLSTAHAGLSRSRFVPHQTREALPSTSGRLLWWPRSVREAPVLWDGVSPARLMCRSDATLQMTGGWTFLHVDLVADSIPAAEVVHDIMAFIDPSNVIIVGATGSPPACSRLFGVIESHPIALFLERSGPTPFETRPVRCGQLDPAGIRRAGFCSTAERPADAAFGDQRSTGFLIELTARRLIINHCGEDQSDSRPSAASRSFKNTSRESHG